MDEQDEQQLHRDVNFNVPRPMCKSALPAGLLPESTIRHTHARSRVPACPHPSSAGRDRFARGSERRGSELNKAVFAVFHHVDVRMITREQDPGHNVIS